MTANPMHDISDYHIIAGIPRSGVTWTTIMQSIKPLTPEPVAIQAHSTHQVLGGSSQGTDRARQIRNIALTLFVKHGYGNVSLRQLAEPLGLRAGSLYNHLENKQTLLFDLMSEHLQDLLNNAIREVALAKEPATQLRAFIANHIYFQIFHKTPSLLSNLELRSLERAHKAEIKTLHDRYRACLGQILRGGISKGLFQNQCIAGAVQAVLAMLCGVAFWFDEQDQMTSEQLTRQFTRMVFGALGAAPALTDRLAP